MAPISRDLILLASGVAIGLWLPYLRRWAERYNHTNKED